MRLAIIGFACGAGLLQTQTQLPDGATCAGLTAIAILVWSLRGAWRGPVSGALAGFCWAAWVASQALASALPLADEGRDLTVIGTIDSLPHRTGQGERFHFLVERTDDRYARVPRRVTLAWYGNSRGPGVAAARVWPGERWQLRVRLQRPHGNANPHGFDYEVWLLEQGIRATGYVRPAGAHNRRLDEFVPSFSNVVQHSRATLRARVLRALPEHDYAGVIVALVVGDQRAIAQSDWKVFNSTGIGHLISISGLHITMVAGLFAMAVSALWRRSFWTGAQLPLLIPAQKVAALAGAFAALLYVLLAGFGIPAQRTLYMLAVVAAALWCGRLASVSHVLCSALGLVLLLDPWAVLAPGFWLSFGAVAVILYATAGRTAALQPRWRSVLLLGVHTQYVVTLGLVPLTMLLFSQFSLASPLANAVAIPLISLFVTPLSLLGSVLPAPLSNLVLGAAHAAVDALAQVLGWLAAMPVAVWRAPAPPVWVFCFAVIGTVWMLAPRGWPLRWLGAIAWLPLLGGQASAPAPGQMQVTAFDVGQGTALLIETSAHRLLYDTGPQYSAESNGGNRIIAPYLHARGIDRLDMVIVSHSDADHAGGALAILDEVKVGQLVSSLWFDHPIARRAPRHGRCMGGQAWQWDGVSFEMLYPTAASYDDPSHKPNARSCVLRVSTPGHALLLAGDIEAEHEAQLVAQQGDRLRSDVLLAPHHGSGTSSSVSFLETVNPRAAIFQVGYRNRYRHPKREVFERYGELGIARFRTDDAGAIELDTTDGFVASQYRKKNARYWHGR